MPTKDAQTISRRAVLSGVLGSVVISAAGLSGCTADPSASRFASTFQAGVNADIDPLESPKEAVDKSVLIVRGHLENIFEGVRIVTTDPEMEKLGMTDLDHATLSVVVKRVVSGDESLLTDGRVYLNILSGDSSASRLQRVMPDAEVLAVIYRLPEVPMYKSRYERLKGLPESAPLLSSFLDGTWLQGPADAQMYSLHGGVSELNTSWSRPTTLDDYEAKINRAK